MATSVIRERSPDVIQVKDLYINNKHNQYSLDHNTIVVETTFHKLHRAMGNANALLSKPYTSVHQPYLLTEEEKQNIKDCKRNAHQFLPLLKYIPPNVSIQEYTQNVQQAMFELKHTESYIDYISRNLDRLYMNKQNLDHLVWKKLQRIDDIIHEKKHALIHYEAAEEKSMMSSMFGYMKVAVDTGYSMFVNAQQRKVEACVSDALTFVMIGTVTQSSIASCVVGMSIKVVFQLTKSLYKTYKDRGTRGVKTHFMSELKRALACGGLTYVFEQSLAQSNDLWGSIVLHLGMETVTAVWTAYDKTKRSLEMQQRVDQILGKETSTQDHAQDVVLSWIGKQQAQLTLLERAVRWLGWVPRKHIQTLKTMLYVVRDLIVSVANQSIEFVSFLRMVSNEQLDRLMMSRYRHLYTYLKSNPITGRAMNMISSVIHATTSITKTFMKAMYATSRFVMNQTPIMKAISISTFCVNKTVDVIYKYGYDTMKMILYCGTLILLFNLCTLSITQVMGTMDMSTLKAFVSDMTHPTFSSYVEQMNQAMDSNWFQYASYMGNKAYTSFSLLLFPFFAATNGMLYGHDLRVMQYLFDTETGMELLVRIGLTMTWDKTIFKPARDHLFLFSLSALGLYFKDNIFQTENMSPTTSALIQLGLLLAPCIYSCLSSGVMKVASLLPERQQKRIELYSKKLHLFIPDLNWMDPIPRIRETFFSLYSSLRGYDVEIEYGIQDPLRNITVSSLVEQFGVNMYLNKVMMGVTNDLAKNASTMYENWNQTKTYSKDNLETLRNDMNDYLEKIKQIESNEVVKQYQEMNNALHEWNDSMQEVEFYVLNNNRKNPLAEIKNRNDAMNRVQVSMENVKQKASDLTSHYDIRVQEAARMVLDGMKKKQVDMMTSTLERKIKQEKEEYKGREPITSLPTNGMNKWLYSLGKNQLPSEIKRLNDMITQANENGGRLEVKTGSFSNVMMITNMMMNKFRHGTMDPSYKEINVFYNSYAEELNTFVRMAQDFFQNDSSQKRISLLSKELEYVTSQFEQVHTNEYSTMMKQIERSFQKQNNVEHESSTVLDRAPDLLETLAVADPFKRKVDGMKGIYEGLNTRYESIHDNEYVETSEHVKALQAQLNKVTQMATVGMATLRARNEMFGTSLKLHYQIEKPIEENKVEDTAEFKRLQDVTNQNYTLYLMSWKRNLDSIYQTFQNVSNRMGDVMVMGRNIMNTIVQWKGNDLAQQTDAVKRGIRNGVTNGLSWAVGKAAKGVDYVSGTSMSQQIEQKRDELKEQQQLSKQEADEYYHQREKNIMSELSNVMDQLSVQRTSDERERLTNLFSTIQPYDKTKRYDEIVMKQKIDSYHNENKEQQHQETTKGVIDGIRDVLGEASENMYEGQLEEAYKGLFDIIKSVSPSLGVSWETMDVMTMGSKRGRMEYFTNMIGKYGDQNLIWFVNESVKLLQKNKSLVMEKAVRLQSVMVQQPSMETKEVNVESERKSLVTSFHEFNRSIKETKKAMASFVSRVVYESSQLKRQNIQSNHKRSEKRIDTFDYQQAIDTKTQTDISTTIDKLFSVDLDIRTMMDTMRGFDSPDMEIEKQDYPGKANEIKEPEIDFEYRSGLFIGTKRQWNVISLDSYPEVKSRMETIQTEYVKQITILKERKEALQLPDQLGSNLMYIYFDVEGRRLLENTLLTTDHAKRLRDAYPEMESFLFDGDSPKRIRLSDPKIMYLLSEERTPFEKQMVEKQLHHMTEEDMNSFLHASSDPNISSIAKDKEMKEQVYKESEMKYKEAYLERLQKRNMVDNDGGDVNIPLIDTKIKDQHGLGKLASEFSLHDGLIRRADRSVKLEVENIRMRAEKDQAYCTAKQMWDYSACDSKYNPLQHMWGETYLPTLGGTVTKKIGDAMLYNYNDITIESDIVASLHLNWNDSWKCKVGTNASCIHSVDPVLGKQMDEYKTNAQAFMDAQQKYEQVKVYGHYLERARIHAVETSDALDPFLGRMVIDSTSIRPSVENHKSTFQRIRFLKETGLLILPFEKQDEKDTSDKEWFDKRKEAYDILDAL